MRSLLRLNPFFLKYKWMILLGILFVTCLNILSIFPAQIFRHSIDTVIESLKIISILGEGEISANFQNILLKSFFLFGGGILILAIVKGFFTFMMRQTIIVMSRKIEFDLKNEIYRKYQELDNRFYKTNKVGDIMNRISEDVSAVRMYIGPAIMYTVNLIVLFIVVVYTMFQINAELSWLVLAPLPLMSILIYYISNLINQRSTLVQEELSSIFSKAQESFSGIRIIKAYNQIDPQKKAFEDNCDEYLKKSMSLVKVNSLFHPIIILLPALSTLITIYAGGLQVIDGTVSYGNIAEFVIYINMLTWPVASLGWVTSLVQKAGASQTRINEFLDRKSEISNPTTNPTDIDGDIVLNHLSYTYPDSGIKAIQDISLTIKRGQTLAILGKTGSGKSTLANLLLRMMDPTSGEITINNTPLTKVNLDQYRSSIGYVPQEIFLFSDNIYNNIAFGDLLSENSMEDVQNAAIKAAIHDNIQDFPNKYQTIVGERGITLSGGQKQRVSIARALLKKPELLIFDDCLSAIDTETEEEILQHLKELMKSKTSIIIAHRISSIKHADHVIYLEDGEISEQGSHVELLASKGAYYELYQKQLVN